MCKCYANCSCFSLAAIEYSSKKGKELNINEIFPDWLLEPENIKDKSKKKGDKNE